jgi:parvulin-like peptidyl-prolyl isomerase
LSFTLLLPLLLAVAPAEGATVATVDGIRITSRELQDRLAGRRQRGEQVGAEAVAQSLVDEVLLAAEAERRKLPLPPALAAQVDAATRRIAGKRHAEAMLDRVTPDEETLRGAFHLNADSAKFKLLVLRSQAAGEAARDRLQKGGSFAQEAKESLHQESARSGGDMGTRNRGALPPDLARVVFEAPLDRVHGPVPLDLGFAVVQVSSRTIGTEAEYQARRPKVVEFARQQLRGSARKHLTEQLRARDKVKLDEAFLISTGSSMDLAQGDKVIAVVAGKPLSYGELLEYVNEVFKGRPQGHAFGASVKVEMANAMIDSAVLEADAVKAGVDRSPAVTAEVAPLRREAMAAALDLAIRETVPAPTEAELVSWHRAHQVDFRVPAARACRALVVQTAADAAAARKRLLGGEPFAEVARAVSLDAATAAKGGDLGEVSFDALAAMERDPAQAELARAMRTSPAGALAGPIAAGGAQYLLRCEAVRPERLLPLSDVRPEVAARLRTESGQRALDVVLARLRSAAKVSIDREAVLRAAPPPH